MVAAGRLAQQHLSGAGVSENSGGQQYSHFATATAPCARALIVVEVVDAGPAQHTGCGEHPVFAGHDPQGVGQGCEMVGEVVIERLPTGGAGDRDAAVMLEDRRRAAAPPSSTSRSGSPRRVVHPAALPHGHHQDQVG